MWSQCSCRCISCLQDRHQQMNRLCPNSYNHSNINTMFPQTPFMTGGYNMDMSPTQSQYPLVPISIVLVVPTDILKACEQACSKLLSDTTLWCSQYCDRRGAIVQSCKKTKCASIRFVLPPSYYSHIVSRTQPILAQILESISTLVNQSSFGSAMTPNDYIFMMKNQSILECSETMWVIVPISISLNDLVSIAGGRVVEVLIQPSTLGMQPYIDDSGSRKRSTHVSFTDDIDNSPTYRSLSSPPPKNFSPIIRKKRVKLDTQGRTIEDGSEENSTTRHVTIADNQSQEVPQYEIPKESDETETETESEEDDGGEDRVSEGKQHSDEDQDSDDQDDDEDTEEAAETVRSKLQAKPWIAKYFSDWYSEYKNNKRREKKLVRRPLFGGVDVNVANDEEDDVYSSSSSEGSISGNGAVEGSNVGSSESSTSSSSSSSSSDSSDSDSGAGVSDEHVLVAPAKEEKSTPNKTRAAKTTEAKKSTDLKKSPKRKSPKKISPSKSQTTVTSDKRLISRPEYVDLDDSSEDYDVKKMKELSESRNPPIESECIWVSLDKDEFVKYLDKRCIEQVVRISQLVIKNGVPTVVDREMVQLKKIPIVSSKDTPCIKAMRSAKPNCIGVARVFVSSNGDRQWSSGGITYINISDLRTVECIEEKKDCFMEPNYGEDPPQPKMDLLKAKRVKRQMAHYFKEANYNNDVYLKSLEDSEGWIPLHKIMEFNKIKCENINLQDLINIVESLSMIEGSRCPYRGYLVRRCPGDDKVETDITVDVENSPNMEESKENKGEQCKGSNTIVDGSETPTVIDV